MQPHHLHVLGIVVGVLKEQLKECAAWVAPLWQTSKEVQAVLAPLLSAWHVDLSNVGHAPELRLLPPSLKPTRLAIHGMAATERFPALLGAFVSRGLAAGVQALDLHTGDGLTNGWWMASMQLALVLLPNVTRLHLAVGEECLDLDLVVDCGPHARPRLRQLQISCFHGVEVRGVMSLYCSAVAAAAMCPALGSLMLTDIAVATPSDFDAWYADVRASRLTCTFWDAVRCGPLGAALRHLSVPWVIMDWGTLAAHLPHVQTMQVLALEGAPPKENVLQASHVAVASIGNDLVCLMGSTFCALSGLVGVVFSLSLQECFLCNPC